MGQSFLSHKELRTYNKNKIKYSIQYTVHQYVDTTIDLQVIRSIVDKNSKEYLMWMDDYYHYQQIRDTIYIGKVNKPDRWIKAKHT